MRTHNNNNNNKNNNNRIIIKVKEKKIWCDLLSFTIRIILYRYTIYSRYIKKKK